MINVQDAIHVHEVLIDKFGGIQGIRDLPMLESALSRPFQTFDQKDLYATPFEKSAALIESILINHPFIDGNKRIGYVLMRLLLMECGFNISASQDEKYDFVISVSKKTSIFFVTLAIKMLICEKQTTLFLASQASKLAFSYLTLSFLASTN